MRPPRVEHDGPQFENNESISFGTSATTTVRSTFRLLTSSITLAPDLKITSYPTFGSNSFSSSTSFRMRRIKNTECSKHKMFTETDPESPQSSLAVGEKKIAEVPKSEMDVPIPSERRLMTIDPFTGAVIFIQPDNGGKFISFREIHPLFIYFLFFQQQAVAR